MEKTREDMFVKGAKKIHPVDVQLDFNQVIFVTEGPTPKGQGIIKLGYKIKDVWADKNGNLVFFADPLSKVENKKYDRYGNEVYDRLEVHTGKPSIGTVNYKKGNKDKK